MSPAPAEAGELVARAFAKVNLGLEVAGKRPDGYHELRTLLQTVDFCDRLHFRRRESGIELSTDWDGLPTGPENLVYRAAELAAAGNRSRGVSIHLEKRIPPGLGLGGGSADAAVTLLALERLWDLQTSLPELHRRASSLGMDVPFFLYGGTALAVGRGDEVYPVAIELEGPIVLILPEFSISTAEAYASLRLTKPDRDLTLHHFVWTGPSVRDGLGELVNHLEGTTREHSSAIQEHKKRLLAGGARAAMMSGSGSAVFGLFEDESAALTTVSCLTREGIRAVLTRALTRTEYRKRWLGSATSSR